MTRIQLACLFAFLMAAQTWAADEPSSVAEAMRGLASENTDHWVACIEFLGHHYREAKGAMLTALDCDHGRFAIGLTGAFAEVGEPAIPDMLRLLPKANKREKVNIAEAIAQMAQLGKKLVPVVPILHGELKSTDFEVREAIIHAVGQIRDARSLPLLKDCLQDRHSDVRGAAIWALCQFEADAQPAASAIVRFAKDEYSRRPNNHMDRAFLSLGMIGGAALKLINNEITDKRNPAELRTYFLEAIVYMANHGKKGDAIGAIPTLRKALEDPDPGLRRCALGTLDIVCGLNSDLDPEKHLDWLFKSKKLKTMSASERVQVASIAAIFKGYRKLAIALFNEGLRSQNPDVVRYAVAGCLSLDEDRPAVAAGLERAMRSQDSGVRWLAVRRVTGDPRYIVAAPRLLWIAISDENEHCREDARRALAAVSDAVWKQYLFPASLKNSLFRAYSVLLDGLGILAGRH